jgi:3-deoxy-D-manno-octulosonic-acid transferase
VSLALYGLATRLAEPMAPALLARRVARGKEDPLRLGERLGRAGRPRPDGVLVWLHGASVGEALSLIALVEALAAARPDVTLLVTSGTRTSAALMAERLPSGAIHQYLPVDGPAAVARFLDHWRPSLGVFVESELWPNLLLAARARGVRLALLSAKLSQASFRGWRRAPAAARRLLDGFDLILAQDDRADERITALGGEVSGIADLKFGAAPLPADAMALAARKAELADRPMILAASTHPSEEALIWTRWRAVVDGRADKPLLVIVPRHPERGAAVAATARLEGFATGLQSADPGLGVDIFIADALGELGLWFRLARLAVMGGSFIAGVGGHNPLEPARLGTPVVSGPKVDNWATAYHDLDAAKAVLMIDGAPGLDDPLRQALDDLAPLAAMAERARAFVASRDSAARRVAPLVLELIP